MSSTAIASNVDVIRGVYTAFDNRDLAAVFGAFAADIDWVHPEGMISHGVGGTKHGQDGVRAFLVKASQVMAGQRLEPKEFVVDGDRIVVFGNRHVVARNGKSGTLRFIHSWTLRDGLVTRLEDSFDTIEMHRLLAD